MTNQRACAIVGSGNIGTDLMYKLLRTSRVLEPVAMVGIDPGSDGLSRAGKAGLQVTSKGVSGLMAMDVFDGIELIFDATSAAAHREHDRLLRPCGKRLIDLTPAAIGPHVVPYVNLQENLTEANVNMVTCGGQATIPLIYAISRVASIHYAEIVASIASESAGIGTRDNIDEFTQTTSRAIVDVGRARHGKAIIVLNPASPPIIMRDTIHVLVEQTPESEIRAAVAGMVKAVQSYVPGYRLKQQVQFETIRAASPLRVPGVGKLCGLKCSIFLEIEGAAHYLPAYAGNLDIMTSAAVRTAECMVETATRKCCA